MKLVIILTKIILKKIRLNQLIKIFPIKYLTFYKKL
jgi:hypothetical protein